MNDDDDQRRLDELEERCVTLEPRTILATNFAGVLLGLMADHWSRRHRCLPRRHILECHRVRLQELIHLELSTVADEFPVYASQLRRELAPILDSKPRRRKKVN